jgi:hypothetical protein
MAEISNLQRPLARRPDGIFAAPFEQGKFGADLFRSASSDWRSGEQAPGSTLSRRAVEALD